MSRRKSHSSWSPITPCEPRMLLAAYVIDAVKGKDTNPGTAAAPWKTYRNIVSYYSESDRPSGWVRLAPGDEVRFRPGTYNLAYKYGPTDYRGLYLNGFGDSGVNGTVNSPIRLIGEPGAVLSARDPRSLPMSAVQLEFADAISLEGFEITGYGGGVRISGLEGSSEYSARGRYCQVLNNYIHDVSGEDNNNIAGIHVDSHANGTLIQGNYLLNNYDLMDTPDDPSSSNNRHIVIFGSADVRVTGNKLENDHNSNTYLKGSGISYKHLGDLEPGEEGTFEVDHNIIENAAFIGIGTASPHSRIHHNLLVDSGPIAVADQGGFSWIDDIHIDHNSIQNAVGILDGSGFYMNTPGIYSNRPVGTISFTDNIVSDNRNPLIDPGIGVIQFATYESDELYTHFIVNRNFTADRNVYHNSGGPVRFKAFNASGEYGELGGDYSFSEWQSLGLDTHGQIINPGFDNAAQPTSLAGQSTGWFADEDYITVMIPVDQDVITEKGNYSKTTAYIVRNGALSAPLTVQLSISDPTQGSVPQTVTIPAGQSRVSFVIQGRDDRKADKTRAVQISATATGFTAVNSWVRIQEGNPSETRVVDDGDVSFGTNDQSTAEAPRYWFRQTKGRGGDSLIANGHAAEGAVARWTFPQLRPGRYRVSATFPASSVNASNATYRILDSHGQVLAVRSVNQRVTPNDLRALNSSWEDIEFVSVSGGSLIVELSDTGNGKVVADSIRIQRVGDSLLTRSSEAPNVNSERWRLTGDKRRRSECLLEFT
jgi:hypothetical protein